MKWTLFFLCLSGISCGFLFLFPCAIASYPVPYPEKSMILLSWLQPSWFFRHGQDPFEESLFQAEQSQFSWSLLVWNAPIPWSSLWPFTALIPLCRYHSCVGESRARPNTPDVSHHSWEKGKDHLPPAGHALPDAAQGTADLHCCKSSVLAHS